jgi:hypothetical protein
MAGVHDPTRCGQQNQPLNAHKLDHTCPRRIIRQSLRPTVGGGLFAQTLWAVLIVTLTHCMLHIKPPSHAQRQKAVSRPMHNACHACSWQLHSWQRMNAGVHRSTLHAWLVPCSSPRAGQQSTAAARQHRAYVSNRSCPSANSV